jgi:superfamily II DNA/RNA helicase
MSQQYLQDEIAELQAEGHIPQVIIGTPARIMRHIPSGVLNTDSLKIVFIDNIDDILSRGLDDSLVQLLRMVLCENIQLVVHSRLWSQWRAIWARVGEFMKSPVRVWDAHNQHR